jgi:hypothetical protein
MLYDLRRFAKGRRDMSLLNTTFFDISIVVFIVAALVNLAIIVIYIGEFRGAPGSLLQIALRQYKSGGMKGKWFAASLLLLIACFAFFIVVRLTK